MAGRLRKGSAFMGVWAVNLGLFKPYQGYTERGSGGQVYVGNLVAGLVTEDALRQLFNTTMQARARAIGARGTAHSLFGLY